MKTPDESTMICFFWKSFKLSIKIEIKQQDQASTSFEEMMQKTINVKTKISLRSNDMIKNWDFSILEAIAHLIIFLQMFKFMVPPQKTLTLKA